MAELEQIPDHATILDSNGEHVGTVDHVEGTRIKLTRTDSDDGKHHYIDGNLVERVEGDVVHLNATADAARQ